MQRCAYRKCGKLFEPKYSGQRYCCRHCSGSATAEAQRAGYKKDASSGMSKTLIRSMLPTYPPKKSCFGYNGEKNECVVLNRLECLYTAYCPFFKTKEQAERDRQKALRRLKNK